MLCSGIRPSLCLRTLGTKRVGEVAYSLQNASARQLSSIHLNAARQISSHVNIKRRLLITRSSISFSPLHNLTQIFSRLLSDHVRQQKQLPTTRKTSDTSDLENDSSTGESGITIEVRQPSITRAVLFLTAFGLLAFGSAAYWSLNDSNHVVKAIKAAASQGLRLGPLSQRSDKAADAAWGPGVTEPEMIHMNAYLSSLKYRSFAVKLQSWCDALGLPSSVRDSIVGAYSSFCTNVIGNIPITKAEVVPILAINTIVFLLWLRSPYKPRLENFLYRNFLHRPSSGKEYTMLTSTFSHKDGWHFAFNNIALWSFGGSCLYLASHEHKLSNFIPEASLTPQFLAFFATAGVFGATISHISSAMLFRRLATSQGLPAALSSTALRAGLGSSAAIWAVVAMTACTRPDDKIALIFLPFFGFPIKYGVAGLLALDLAGVIRGWKMFDHVAHLAGASFGFFYYQYGSQFWEQVKNFEASWLRLGPYDAERRKTT